LSRRLFINHLGKEDVKSALARPVSSSRRDEEKLSKERGPSARGREKKAKLVFSSVSGGRERKKSMG